MIGLLVAATVLAQPSLLIQNGNIVNGTGSAPYTADVRVSGDKIVAIGKLTKLDNETVIDATNLVVAPGFIDSHSHADGGIVENPDALSQLRQGITTAVVGQDGYWPGPVREQMNKIEAARPALNFAFFSGAGGIRRFALGADYKRAASLNEIAVMKAVVDADMKSGSLGLSTGLEYDPGYYSDTTELIELSKIVSNYGGMYISHVRDEGNGALKSFSELIEIARQAKVPAQISHIKLATAPVWGKTQDVFKLVSDARRSGLDITADVYPYLYWQSTITALSVSRDWENRKVWEDALAEIGGPHNVLLSSYTHNSDWVGKTIKDISDSTNRDPIEVIQEIVRKTRGPGGSGSESVVVTAMTEPDLIAFLKNPHVMFCSDGSIGGSHPRGAGSFPRILGRFVREQNVISLQEAVRKMTSLPASRFRLAGRGTLKPGMVADIVVFDPRTIADRASPSSPKDLSEGVKHVIVSGALTLRNETYTGERAGKVLKPARKG